MPLRRSLTQSGCEARPTALVALTGTSEAPPESTGVPAVDRLEAAFVGDTFDRGAPVLHRVLQIAQSGQ